MNHPVTVTLLAALALFSAPAFAIYKCEAGGKVTYSDESCTGGKQLDLNTAPAADSSADGQRRAQQKRELKRLEKERHQREAKDERQAQSANRASAARQRKCDALSRRQERAVDDVRRSVGKANEKAKLKSRRVTEDYEAACGRWPARELSVAR